jgi:light-regulated signal transduction histidine kinase (bacteriophytochrome)
MNQRDVLNNAGLHNHADYDSRLHVFEPHVPNDELDVFAHDMGHDLRGPLSSILSYAILLSECYDEWPEDLKRQSLRAVASSAQKMVNIMDEILVLSGLRATEPVMMPVDINTIVQDALQCLAYNIEDCAADIVSPETWPVAIGYDPWIKEIWINYLYCAMKYGGQPPCVKLGADAPKDEAVRFWVRSNGTTLTPEEIERLFTRPTHVGRTRANGEGLGMPVVQRLVTLMGGRVGIDCEIECGSTFWFSLPAPRNT